MAAPSKVLAVFRGPQVFGSRGQAHPKLMVAALALALSSSSLTALRLSVPARDRHRTGVGRSGSDHRASAGAACFDRAAALRRCRRSVLLPLVILIFGLGPPSRIAGIRLRATASSRSSSTRSPGMRNVNHAAGREPRAAMGSLARANPAPRHFPNNMVATVFTGQARGWPHDADLARRHPGRAVCFHRTGSATTPRSTARRRSNPPSCSG